MRGISICLLLALPITASAQAQMSTEARVQAVTRVRSMAACLADVDNQLRRLLDLIRSSEEQRTRARDEAARVDAERAIEQLVLRASALQDQARQCVATDLPRPAPVWVDRAPPRDPTAESVAQPGNSLPTVEADTRLVEGIHVVRGEQVDGEGRIEASEIRSAMRGIASRLSRCHEQYLVRGSAADITLELEFRVSPSGSVGGVNVARSDSRDARFDNCVRTAGRALRVSRPPVGGEAAFGYRLRFGE